MKIPDILGPVLQVAKTTGQISLEKLTAKIPCILGEVPSVFYLPIQDVLNLQDSEHIL